MKGSKDPIHHARTSRPRAGESMKDNVMMPALVVIGLALVSFVGCLVAFATQHQIVGVVLAVVAAVGFVVGTVWVAVERRKVRHVDERWYAKHPDTQRQPPSR